MSEALCFKSDGLIFFPVDQIPKKNEVMRTLGVRNGTFAGNMISRLYDYYFDGAIDFAEEYRKYYSKEFNSLEDFIEEHYNIDKERAVIYARYHFCMKECSRRSIERNVETLIDDKEFKVLFAEAVGGIDDEDPDRFYY